MCVCVCVCACSSCSSKYVSLKSKDTFCLYNLIKILSSFLIQSPRIPIYKNQKT